MIGAEGRGRLFGGKDLTGVCKIFPRRNLLLKRSPGYLPAFYCETTLGLSCPPSGSILGEDLTFMEDSSY